MQQSGEVAAAPGEWMVSSCGSPAEGEQQQGYLTVRRKTARSRFFLMSSNSSLSRRRFNKWDPSLPGRDDYL